MPHEFEVSRVRAPVSTLPCVYPSPTSPNTLKWSWKEYSAPKEPKIEWLLDFVSEPSSAGPSITITFGIDSSDVPDALEYVYLGLT